MTPTDNPTPSPIFPPCVRPVGVGAGMGLGRGTMVFPGLVDVEVWEEEGGVDTICPSWIQTPWRSLQQVVFWLPQQTLWSGQKVMAASPPLSSLPIHIRVI
jgi:hypothetical protein